MTETIRPSGWDQQAIHRIADAAYGGLQGLFEAMNWPERGRDMMPAVGARVVAAYESVANFVAAHEPPDMPGLDEILAAPAPDVWLTGSHGFAPHNWGFLGFTRHWMRDRFLRESRPGALVVVYGASRAAKHERGKVLGVQQMSHHTGSAREFMSPEAWKEKFADPDRRDKWNDAVQAVRAWKVTPETRPDVREFAPITFKPARALVIGAQGMCLTFDEARNMLALDLREVPVFRGAAVEQCVAGPAAMVLRPSKAGPVSGTGRWIREAEGPKHLYILRLTGNCDHFLGEPAGDSVVIKVGMSRSPSTRCDDHNRALPKCAFSWTIERSTFAEGRDPFPSSHRALVGEQAMKDYLERAGRSLGGEFFLASPDRVERAWRMGVSAAENGGEITTSSRSADTSASR
jgi:hypothetical protein